MNVRQLLHIADLANRHVPRLQALPESQLDYMESIITGADIVYVVWQDESLLPHAIGTLLIKGRKLQAKARRTGGKPKGTIDAVPCRHRFEAEALNDAFGDGSTVITDYAPPPPGVVPHLLAQRGDQNGQSLPLTELAGIVEQAHRTSAMLRATDGDKIDVVQALFDEADLVHGVWQDDTAEHGVGHMLLKGANLARDVIATGRPMSAKSQSFELCNADEGYALRTVFGDGASDLLQ
jgi:hypothetical protein